MIQTLQDLLYMADLIRRENIEKKLTYLNVLKISGVHEMSK